MTTAVRARKKAVPKRNRAPTDGWWGDGPSPWEREDWGSAALLLVIAVFCAALFYIAGRLYFGHA